MRRWWRTKREKKTDVLAVIQKPGRHYGIDIAREARVSSGTLYVCLRQLEGEGYIAGFWDNESPRPRRFYEVKR